MRVRITRQSLTVPLRLMGTYCIFVAHTPAILTNYDRPHALDIDGLRPLVERAVLHDAVNDHEYYYFTRELWSVEGLVNNRGHEVERTTYDAYGYPVIYAINNRDVNYDGVMDIADRNLIFVNKGNDPCSAGPIFDVDGDGDIDDDDYADIPTSPTPAVTGILNGGVGNPYQFTGRRLDNVGNTGEMLYHYRARAYQPYLWMRFLQRDPAGYVDGWNLYEYVGSNPTGATDPLGQWKFKGGKRDSRTPRAVVVAETNDTAETLAKKLRLEADEFDLWMVPIVKGTLPKSKSAKVCPGREFSVPNTVIVAWGDLPGLDTWALGIFSRFRRTVNIEQQQLEFRGFHVRELNPATNQTIEQAFMEKDLIIFFYSGHGSGSGALVPQPPEEQFGSVSEKLYRERSSGLHKLAGMRLLTCFSADNTKTVLSAGISAETWSSNVSSVGVFSGFTGAAGMFDADERVFVCPGNPPKEP